MNAPTREAIVLFRTVSIADDGTVRFHLSQMPSPDATRVGMRVTLPTGTDEAKVKQFLNQQCIKAGIVCEHVVFQHVPSVKYPGYTSFSLCASVVEKGDAFPG